MKVFPWNKSASLFRWGRLYAEGPQERTDFVNTAQRLEAVARSVRDGVEPDLAIVDDIFADGYHVMAEEQVGLALDQWNAGEHLRVALLMHAVADELDRGFALSNEKAEDSIDGALESARTIADELETSHPPTEADVREALKGLEEVVRRLGVIRAARPLSEGVTPR